MSPVEVIARLRKIPLEVFLFLIPFAVYWVTAPRTVTMEDSGLYILYANFLGLNHPSGYPLHTLLGKLFIIVFPGSVAFRVHLLSMAAGSLTVVLFFRMALLHGVSRFSAACAALVLAFGGTFWFQAIVAEVYMLNAAFFFGAYLLALLLREKFRAPFWYLFCLILGLAYSAHLSLSVFATPALFMLLWSSRARIVTPRMLSVGALCFGLGLSPYLHLLLAPLYTEYFFFKPINTPGELIAYLNRQAYRAREGGVDFAWVQIRAFVFAYARRLIFEFTPVLFGVAVFGFLGAKSLGRARIAAVLWILVYSLSILIFWRYEYSDHTLEIWRHFQLFPLVALALLVAAGMDRIQERVSSGGLSGSWRGIQWIPAACVLLLSALVFMSWRKNDLRRASFADEHGRIVLESLPEEALLILKGDENVWPIGYLNKVAAVRPDVKIVARVGGVFPDRLFNDRDDASLQKVIDASNFILAHLASGRRVFSTDDFKKFGVPGHRFPFRIRDGGLAYELVRSREPLPVRPRTILAARRFMDRYLAGEFPDHFRGLARDTLWSYCRLFDRQGVAHQALREPECLLRFALEKSSRGDYRSARTDYLAGLKTIRGMNRHQKAEYWNFFLRNSMLLADEISPGERQGMIIGEVLLAVAAWYDWADCKNPLAPTLLRLQAWRYVESGAELERSLKPCLDLNRRSSP